MVGKKKKYAITKKKKTTTTQLASSLQLTRIIHDLLFHHIHTLIWQQQEAMSIGLLQLILYATLNEFSCNK